MADFIIEDTLVVNRKSNMSINIPSEVGKESKDTKPTTKTIDIADSSGKMVLEEVNEEDQRI